MSTVWTREQEEELAELFQRYKGEQGMCVRNRGRGGMYTYPLPCSCVCERTSSVFISADIVSCIMAALEGGEVKRSRKQIVNQLVRLELVEDRKSLLKKPPRKKMVSHVATVIMQSSRSTRHI